MLWSISEMSSWESFQTFALAFSTPENLLVGNYWISMNEKKATF